MKSVKREIMINQVSDKSVDILNNNQVRKQRAEIRTEITINEGTTMNTLLYTDDVITVQELEQFMKSHLQT